MLIDFLIICKWQIFVQFQFSVKKKLLSQDSYKAKGVHHGESRQGVSTLTTSLRMFCAGRMKVKLVTNF